MAKKSLTFIQVQGLIERGSFLNQYNVVKSPYITYDSVNQSYAVRNSDNDNAKLLGLYQNINTGVWSFTFSTYGAVFFGLQKNFGFDLRFKFKTALSKVPYSDFRNSFDLLAGPVFRWETNKDASLLTIGIKAGFVNAPVGTQVLKQNFGAKLEVGVPFKWYKPA